MIVAKTTSRTLLSLALSLLSVHLFSQAEPSSDLILIRDAAQAIAAGDLGRAEDELQTVLKTNPTEYRAVNLLGIVRVQQHREGEAEQLFKQAIKQRPDFASAHMDLGLLYLQLNRGDEAEPEFRETLRLDPGRMDARAALVKLYRAQAADAAHQQNFEKAVSLLIQARKLSPQDHDVLFEFGMSALRMSLFPDAIQAFEETLEVQNEDSKAIYGLGRAQIGLARFQDARESFERYVQLRPEDASGYYALGFVLRALQQIPEARRQFEKSIQLQPAQSESYFCLGLLDLDENNLDDASKHFSGVLKRDPKHAGALTGLGRVAFQRKQYQTACDLLQTATISDPSLREAHYYLGMAYARLGRKEDSEKELQTAGQLDREEVQKLHLVMKLLDPNEETAPNSAEPK
jgi:Flp pilus assembly protein TadD